MALWTPSEEDWEAFNAWCKKTDAWNSFSKDGVTCPSLTITQSEQSFLFAYRNTAQVMAYLLDWINLHRVNSDFFDSDFDNALDDVRVSMWRYKDTNGKPWKGLDAPSTNGYKLYYQGICFSTIARQLIHPPVPPVPENEFSANEHNALKAFAGGLEATQEFVPDSWFSPDIQIETNKSRSEEVNWTKQKTWRRSLGEVVTASRKALRTALQRQ